MKKITPALLLALLLSACASTRYGYKTDEWNSMSPGERDQAVERAESMVERAQELKRENEFIYQSINAVFGSRSNVYGSKQLTY